MGNWLNGAQTHNPEEAGANQLNAVPAMQAGDSHPDLLPIWTSN